MHWLRNEKLWLLHRWQIQSPALIIGVGLTGWWSAPSYLYELLGIGCYTPYGMLPVITLVLDWFCYGMQRTVLLMFWLLNSLFKWNEVSKDEAPTDVFVTWSFILGFTTPPYLSLINAIIFYVFLSFWSLKDAVPCVW